jgi:hypothetical protein
MSELLYYAHISTFYWGEVWVELSPVIKLKELTMQHSLSISSIAVIVFCFY